MNAELTEAAVLDEALALLSSDSGFVNNRYFAVGPLRDYGYEPGEDVVAACAVGGVEQGIWKLVGEVVTYQREELAYVFDPAVAEERTVEPAFVCYGRVMARLNRLADQAHGRAIEQTGKANRPVNVEEVAAFCAEDDVLALFRAARAEVAEREAVTVG